MIVDVIKAVFLGIVEGLTEFIPVSSTGHLLLVQRFFGFADEDFGKTFAILIQFGAILALLSIYFVELWKLAIGFFTDPARRRFVIGVLLAFLPAAVVGAIAHDFIKNVLFNEWLICFMLIAIGFAVSFVCAWVVVKTFLGYVQRHGFSLFAWWRVLVGSLGLIALALGK